MLPGLGFAVRRFLAAAEHPHHAAGRIELDDHVRALVDRPDVVVLVDAHAVGERPGVEALADLADILAVAGELEELRGRRRIGRTAGAVRAREHEDVALGVHRHARAPRRNSCPPAGSGNSGPNRRGSRARFAGPSRAQRAATAATERGKPSSSPPWTRTSFRNGRGLRVARPLRSTRLYSTSGRNSNCGGGSEARHRWPRSPDERSDIRETPLLGSRMSLRSCGLRLWGDLRRPPQVCGGAAGQTTLVIAQGRAGRKGCDSTVADGQNLLCMGLFLRKFGSLA